MKRILVVLDRRMRMDRVRDELERRSREQVLEVFLLCCLLGWGLRGPLRRKRFWRAKHAQLDAALEELTAMGILSDGLTTPADPMESVGNALRAFRPDEVIIAHAGRAGRYEDGCRRALAAYASEPGHPVQTSWLPA